MKEQFSDKELQLNWVYFGEHLKVTSKGTLLFNSVTNFISPALTPYQTKWITEHYHKMKKQYVF